MRVVVIGAGLGGLATAMRLQGRGHEVTVVEQQERPGGRAYQLRDAGFTWDTGPSLVTMPWVLEETFAAAGLDLHSEVRMRQLDPFYRIRWAGDGRHLDFSGEREAMVSEIAKFSSRDAAAYDGFLDALRPIYEQGILAAGRRPFLGAGEFARFAPSLVRLGAARTLWRLVARHFHDPRVREAFSFHSLFIGGDPFRVPAIYAALVLLQIQDGVWYTDGGVYSLVEAMARTLDVRCGERVERVEHHAGRVRGVRFDTGERLPADAVVSNADVLRSHELLGLPAPRRQLRPTMSCFLLYLGCDRQLPGLLHHTLLVGPGYRRFIADVTRRGALPRTLSTYVHAPTRTDPAMAPGRGDSIAILLPVPNLRSGVDWGREAEGLRDRVLEDCERTFGVRGLRVSIQVEHRMTPTDFRDRLGAVDGNAFAVEPTLHQSAYLRHPNRDRRVGGMYHVGGGTHPGAGIPGVLLGAEITAGLVDREGPAPTRGARRSAVLQTREPEDVTLEARATTRRAARTFALACRLLPRDVRDDVYLLYLTFRTLDDLVDEDEPDAVERVTAVERWCRGDAPATMETRVLEDLATRHPIPPGALLDFCEGMRHDLERRVIRTEDDLDRYCFRVAGTVGIVMAAMLGVTERAAFADAAALGMAMQRTNIIRDIDEDRDAGRLYLARETLERFGGSGSAAREPLLRDQIGRAEALYERGTRGLGFLMRGRPAIAAAAAMYREILREIARQRYGAHRGRVAVPRWRKVRVAAPPALAWAVRRRPRARGSKATRREHPGALPRLPVAGVRLAEATLTEPTLAEPRPPRA